MDTNVVIGCKLYQAMDTASQARAFLLEAQNAQQTLAEALNNAQGIENYEVILEQSQRMLANAQGTLANALGMLDPALGMLSHTLGMLEGIKNITQEAKGILADAQGTLANALGMLAQSQDMLAKIKYIPQEAQRFLAHAQGMLEKAQSFLAHAQGMLEDIFRAHHAKKEHTETTLGTSPGMPVNSMTFGQLVLKCSITQSLDFDFSSPIKFSICNSSDSLLVNFTLNLINTGKLNEYSLSANCYNNVFKIGILNKCIQEGINISLDQYFNLESFINNGVYFYVFKFTITLMEKLMEKNNVMYCTVTLVGDKFVCNIVEYVDENILKKELDPSNYFKKKDHLEHDDLVRTAPPQQQQQLQVDGTPNSQINTSGEVNTELTTPPSSVDRIIREAKSLSMVVNDIVLHPNRNVNGLTDKTEMYTHFVKEIYSEKLVVQRSVSISDQIKNRGSEEEKRMGDISLKSKSINDRIDIRHDIRTILKENDAVNNLNRSIGSISDHSIAGGSVHQLNLLKAQQDLLQNIEEDMTQREYIFEKMPQTVQKTKNQVFAEFIADVIIMARKNNQDHNNINIAPFVYEESGRGINYENFKKFYREIEGDDMEMDLFYSNLIDKVSSLGVINDDVYRTVNKYIESILRYNYDNNPNPTTISKSKIQQIDACKVGRNQRKESPRNGIIRNVFGCLDVTIDYLLTNQPGKNIYSVTITNSLNSEELMTCNITQDIPLKAVSNYLNNNYKELITLYDKTSSKVTADTRGDDCEEPDSGGTVGLIMNVKFSNKNPNIQALCIEALKTVCDKLYKVSYPDCPLPRIISTVDDLVRGDPRIDYLFGIHPYCPTVCRSSANGYLVYGGTTDDTEGFSAIFCRNLIFICFLFHYYSKQINIDAIFPDFDVTNIISYRLINYLNRFDTIRKWCDNKQLIKDKYRDYDFFMIQIICDEYVNKVQKLNNYISNVNTIIGNYVINNDFSTFYGNIIGLENLENLLTMSSLNFYISNEDYLFNPDKKYTFENICSQFQGIWVNDNDADANEQTHDVIDQNRIYEIFSSILELECDINTITIKFIRKQQTLEVLRRLISENDELIDHNDTSTVTDSRKYKYILLKTPKTLELLVKLHRFHTCKLKTNRDEIDKSDSRTGIRKLQDENKKITELLEKTLDSITYIIYEFYQNIGVNINVQSIRVLIDNFDTEVKNLCNRLLNLDEESSDVTKYDMEIVNNEVATEPAMLNKDFNNVQNTTNNTGIPSIVIGTATERRIDRTPSAQSAESAESNGSKRTASNASIKSDASIKSLSTTVRSTEQTSSNKPLRKIKKPKTGKNPGYMDPTASSTARITKKKGGTSHKTVTRRKNKKSPKRKTIKKRKMQKRKNKTRRNK